MGKARRITSAQAEHSQENAEEKIGLLRSKNDERGEGQRGGRGTNDGA